MKLASVVFVDSVAFANGEILTIVPGGATKTQVQFAKLEADGSAVPIEKGQRSEGLLLRREILDRVANRPTTAIAFVPLTNVRSMQFAP